MIPSFATLFALALLTARALRVEPTATAVGCVVFGAVAVAAEAVRPMENGPVSFVLVVLFEACFGLAVAGGAYVRWVDWRRTAAAESARQDERLEIARELHDLVGHYVTGIIVQAQAARHVAPQHPEAAVEALERIELAGGQAMASMRRMVGGLRDDSPTAPGASWDDIRTVVETAAADGMPVRLQVDPDVLGTSGDLALSAHRIVFESLTNVRRHAREVTRVDVELRTDRSTGSNGSSLRSSGSRSSSGRLVVSVSDDGLPATITAQDTFGLVGMHERAEALGGSLYAGPGPSGGWLVRAELPMDVTA
jgi:signal transduction histidine kinase